MKGGQRKERAAAMRRRIIEAAFRAFVRKGFRGTSNWEIAREAGVSPGLIYWYFRDKEDLFRAVVVEKSMVLPLQQLAEEMRDAPPRQFLARLADMTLGLYQDASIISAMRLLWPEAIRNPRVRRLFVGRAIRPAMRALAAYLAAQQARGQIRSMDPQVGARLLLGLFMGQFLLGRMFQVRLPVPAERLFAEAIEIYLRGALRSGAGDENLPGGEGLGCSGASAQ